MAVIAYVFDAQLSVCAVLERQIRKLIHLEHLHELQAEVACPEIAEGWCIGFSCVDGRFRIFEVDSCEADDETGYSIITATDRAVRELGDIVLADRRVVAMTPAMAVEHLISGTGWRVAANTAGNALFSFRAWYTTLGTALLTDVPEKCACLIEPYYVYEGGKIVDRCIDVLSKDPVWRGRLIESGDGSNSVTVKMTGIPKTALYGRGKGLEIENGEEGDSATYGKRLSFADVEWSVANGDPADKPLGQEWVGDPDALAVLGRDGRHRLGVVVFSDEEDKNVLLRRTWAELQLQKSAVIAVSAEVVDLEMSPGNEHRAIRMNDMVVIRPATLPGDYILPVTQIKRNYTEPELTSISAGSIGKTTTNLMADLTHAVEGMEGKSAVWDRANAFGVDGALDVMKSQIISTQGGWYTDPATGSIMLESYDGTRAMMLNGSGFLIADSKTGEEWNWRTAATGGGIVADSITAGVLNAALVRILGNTNFFWDSGNIYIINPDDISQQIRIGLYDGARYGIGFTRDGGTTWQTAMDFNGLNVQATGFAKVFVQLEPPTDNLNVGDIWVQQRQPTTWDTLSAITWDSAAQYVWDDFTLVDPKTYVWDGNVWVLSMDVPLLESYGTQIEANAKAIELKADGKTVETLTVRVDESEKTVEELTSDVETNTDDIVALAKRTTEAEASIRVVAGAVENKAEKTVVTTLTERVGSVETDTSALDERVTGVEYYATELGKIVEKNSATLTTQADEIAARVKYSEYNSLTGRVVEAEAELTAQAMEIAAKVSKDGVIQAILLSTEGLKIDVSKLDINGFVSLNGDVTISQDGTLTTKNMVATNAAISGTFTAPYAYIGEQTYKHDGYSGLFFSGSPTFNPNNIKAAVARDSYGDYHFSTTDGSLYLDTNLSGLVLINGSQLFLTAYASDETLVIGRDGMQPDYQDVCVYPDSSTYESPRGNCGTPAHPWDTCTADQFFSDNAIKSRSSRALKKDIAALGNMGPMIDALTPVQFRYKHDARERLHYGLIFEDTEPVAPVLCSREGSNPEGCRIEYEPINIILLQEVKALRKRLSHLEGVMNCG